MTTGADIAAEVVSALAAEGLANRITFMRAGEPSGSGYSPTSGATEILTAVCRPMSAAQAKAKAGTTITETMRAFTVYNDDLGITPGQGDTACLYSDPQFWNVAVVEPMDFDETPYAWMVVLDR